MNTAERKERAQQIRSEIQQMREQRKKLGNLPNILYATGLVLTLVFGLLVLWRS